MKKSNSLYLKIAGFIIAVYFKKTKNKHYIDKIYRQIKYSYKNFLENNPKRIDFIIDIKETNVFNLLFKKSLNFILFLRRFKKNRVLTFSHISFSQFNAIILIALNRLLYNKGFILHGSAVVYNGEAFIFTGKSGAGKSTIMRFLSKEFFPIADDMMIIKKESNEYFVYQTPFTEKAKWIRKGKEKYKIKRIFFLKKAKFLKIKEINNIPLIVKKLFNQFFTEREYLRNRYQVFFDFIRKNGRFYYFYFKKNEETVFYFHNYNGGCDKDPRGRRRLINLSIMDISTADMVKAKIDDMVQKLPKDQLLNRDN